MEIPSGERHELCRAVHAEQNTIIQAATHGVCLQDASMYLTTTPCSICSKMMINAGIWKIVCDGDYPDDLARDMLESAGIVVVVQ